MTIARFAKRSTRGQTSVEYILLIAIVVAGALIMQKALQPELVKIFQIETTKIQSDAWNGGRANSLSFYAPSGAAYACSNNGSAGGSQCPPQ